MWFCAVWVGQGGMRGCTTPSPWSVPAARAPAGFLPVAFLSTSIHLTCFPLLLWGILIQTPSKPSFPSSSRVGLPTSGDFHLPQVCSPSPPSLTPPPFKLHSGHLLQWPRAPRVQNLLLTFPSTSLLPEVMPTHPSPQPPDEVPSEPLPSLPRAPASPHQPHLGLDPHISVFQTGFPSTPSVTLYKSVHEAQEARGLSSLSLFPLLSNLSPSPYPVGNWSKRLQIGELSPENGPQLPELDYRPPSSTLDTWRSSACS